MTFIHIAVITFIGIALLVSGIVIKKSWLQVVSALPLTLAAYHISALIVLAF